MAISADVGPTLTAALERLSAVVDESEAGATLSYEAREDALVNAHALFDACGGGRDALTLALLGYAAELLSAIAVDLAATPRQARRLIDRLDTHAGVPRAALGRELLGSGRLLELPVEIAIEVQLALLLAFIGAESISLWTLSPSGELEHISHAGALDHAATPARAAAHRALGGDRERPEAAATTLAVRIDVLRPPPAVLVAQRADPGAGAHEPLLAAAVPILAALLDRAELLAREQAHESVVSTVERRLARLRFDLHDGPQQDVHLLAQDLRLFRDQLRPLIAQDPDRDRALGRLDDLEAQLVALDGDLRRLSSAVQSPFLAAGSLPDALAQLTDVFASRTGVVVQTRFSGTPTQLTDSQQIALLSLTREALSNVRKHSNARHVKIEIASGAQGVRVEVRDDGSGFDPETTLVRAARAGRLGLVGMHERVRMLGGRTQIESRPGGPTVISASLPPWPTAASQ